MFRSYFTIIALLDIEKVKIGYFQDLLRSFIVFYGLLLNSILWKAYLKWKEAQKLLNKKWRDHLNLIESIKKSKIVSKKAECYRLLSSEKTLLVIAITIWSISAISLRTTTQSGYPYGTLIYEYVSVFWICIVLLPSIIFFFIILNLNDVLGIKRQLRGASFIVIIFFIAMIINICVIPLSAIRILISYSLVCIASCLVGIKIVYIKELQISRVTNRDRSDSTFPDSNKTTFKDLWINKQLFELFANHCVREYSSETLLYLLELNQCKNLIVDHYLDIIQDDMVREELLNKINLNLAKEHFEYNISLDSVHLDYNEMLTVSECMKAFKYLYDRYIDDESINTINISYSIRKEITKTLSKHHLMKTAIKGENGKKKHETTNTQTLVIIHSFRAKSCDEAVKSLDFNYSNDYRTLNVKSASYRSDMKVCDMIIDILSVFEKAAYDVILMLYKDTWTRFKKTKEFQEFDQSNLTISWMD